MCECLPVCTCVCVWICECVWVYMCTWLCVCVCYNVTSHGGFFSCVYWSIFNLPMFWKYLLLLYWGSVILVILLSVFHRIYTAEKSSTPDILYLFIMLSCTWNMGSFSKYFQWMNDWLMNGYISSFTHLKANHEIQYISTTCVFMTQWLFSRHKLFSLSHSSIGQKHPW